MDKKNFVQAYGQGICSFYSNFLLLQEHFDTDKGLSFDSKPAELVTKNQEWIIWSMKYFLHFNL